MKCTTTTALRQTHTPRRAARKNSWNNANIDPISGEALDKITATVLSTDKKLVQMAGNIMKGYEKNCKRDCKKKKKKKK